MTEHVQPDKIPGNEVGRAQLATPNTRTIAPSRYDLHMFEAVVVIALIAVCLGISWGAFMLARRLW